MSIIIPISVPKGLFSLLIFIDIFFAPCPSIERGNYGRKAKIRMKTLAVAGLILCAVFCMILPRFNNVILITLIMVHVEFMIKYVMERRSLC